MQANPDSWWGPLYRELTARVSAIRQTVDSAAVIDYLRTHPDAVRGETLDYFLGGGDLEFSLSEREPLIDSRNDSCGVGFGRAVHAANEPKAGWETVFAKHDVGWTILSMQHPLNRIVELNPCWIRAFSNQQAPVFPRVS